jgi:hypothetical protein
MKIKNFQLNSSNLIRPEIYYIIGALRDGCLTAQNTIKIKQKNKQWLSDVLVPLFKQVFDRDIKNNIYIQKDYATVWYLAFKDREIWKILKEFQTKQPETKKEQKFYISGFWDADGGCPKKPTLQKKIYIKFTQKDKKSLEELKEMIENFGIRCGKIRLSEDGQYGKIWRFTITNTNGIIKFCKQIGSLHPEKNQRLKRIVELLSARKREHEAFMF